MLKRLHNTISHVSRTAKQRLRNTKRWPSETSKCRSRLAPYCIGNGVDLGFGGDPITPAAIRVDRPNQYSTVGNLPVQLCGDAADLLWFRDNCLDFVFSSHLLEDFKDTEAVLREWLRVIKPGGNLVIFCPDEQQFRAHCRQTNQPYNTHHVHLDFSLDYVNKLLDRIGKTQVTYTRRDVDVYSWDLVAVKT